MKNIAIIPNYSGITGYIKDGEVSPNFLVKSESDGKIYYSNSEGYYIMAGGERYNMYKEGDALKAAFDMSGGFSFQMFKTGENSALTLDCDMTAIATCNGSNIVEETDTLESASTFGFVWTWGNTSWEVTFYPPGSQAGGGYLLQVNGTYGLTDQECCELEGCNWENNECNCPTCEELSMCGVYPDCYPCGEDCDGDLECECMQQGGFWNGEDCEWPEPAEPAE